MSQQYQLAQLNIALMRAPLEDPVMDGFSSQLDHINAVADSSPGFVWRLQTEEGDATAIQVFDDPLILVNMSVWASKQALHDYVYKSEHMKLLRDRREWFQRLEGPGLVLWWVKTGHQPDPDEARQKLDLLAHKGPTADAFTFGKHFTAPSDLA